LLFCCLVVHATLTLEALEFRLLLMESKVAILSEQLSDARNVISKLNLRLAGDNLSQPATRKVDPGIPLHTRETFSPRAPEVPPLDSSVTWSRQHDEDGTFQTHEMLSLIFNETANKSYAWPVYIQLTTVHEQGDATGTYVRMHKDRGNGWAAAYHTDLMSGPLAGGCNIGANIEITNPSPNLRAIGVNIQQEDKYADAAINVQNNELKESGPWTYGLHFDTGSHGKTAIQIDGSWSKGLDVGPNDIHMAAGTRLYLSSGDEKGDRAVALRFNVHRSQLEILCGGSLIAFLPLDPGLPPRML